MADRSGEEGRTDGATPGEGDEDIRSEWDRTVAGERVDRGDDEFPPTPPGSAISRRGMLTYGVGSALATWLVIGAGWLAFFYERTGPEEDVVREYVAAVDRSHFYTAQELFHENAPDQAWRPQEIPDVERVDLIVEETEVVDRETEPETEGVEEVALVHADVTIDDGSRSELLELAFVVAKNEDGEWKLWQDT